ncbi:hypothetical protein CVT25_001212 [Psilocybe cyanescens]|uniref:DNA replication regulator Sld3 C-terminal domain-containing protein n=1 Tax=Psilocybe cyanescens TaxID=93625 RepID=A0A409XKE9_PSICY|nr:hypothetical protein CVT25_001212 [Psilocybe cyanescens]
MATIVETEYILDDRKTANWTKTQEKTISTEYPFSTQNEPLDQFVARTYLQFLWLPESIMPLNLLIPSLRRVNAPSTSSDASVHPMHAFLEPLLLTTTTVTNKYHTELPQILSEGGGAGEMEETMMWYSLTHEKGNDGAPNISEHDDGPWTDDKWRHGYMERMERREVQIQVLLWLYKLSLPGPAPPEKKKRKRKRSRKDDEPDMTTEDYLEAFMDRLSMWQLLSTLERTKNTGEERDWIQAFTQAIVEPIFKTQVPELCSLLHSKVFPSSPFSDTESPTLNKSSPEPQPKRALSRAPSVSQIPSPTLSTSSRTTARTKSKLARARSRSLSVSLAQELKERERASSIPSKKPVFNREVSMSRVFKPKPKPKQTEETIKTEPVLPPPKPSANLGVTLVEETPVKARVASSTTFGRQPSFSFGAKSSTKVSLPLVPESPVEGEEGEEEWMMESSPPDIVFLNPKRGPNGVVEMDSDDDDDDGEHFATPSKPSRSSSRLSKR